MTEINRRTLLAGTAMASAAAALSPLAVPAPAQAAAPPVGKQNAGWYRYKVGDAEVTVVTDGINRFKFPDGFVAGKSRAEISAAKAAVGLQPGPDMIAIPYSPVAINSGGKLIVIDTGTGEGNFANSKGAAGQFHSNLVASGINPADVDIVLISHFHGDHINGLLGTDGKPKFAKAEIMVSAAEWKYFMDDAEMNKQTTPRMKGVFAGARKVFDGLGRKVTPFEPGKEVAPGLTAYSSPGHTPGHSSFVLASGNSKVMIQGDVTNTTVFVRNPGWHLMFDQDAQMAETTRRKLYDMAVAEKMPIQGFHYPFPALAMIEKSGDGYRETMIPWSPTI